MILLRLPIAVAVLFYQSFFLALSQLWANKIRAVLTMIGIVIGVASVIAVIATLTGLRSTVLSEFESFGTSKMFVGPRRPSSGPMKAASWSQIEFKPDMFEHLAEHCPSLKYFTRMTNLPLTITAGEHSEEAVTVWGIDPAWHRVENRFVTLGRPFSLVDSAQAKPVCLINTKLRDKLGLATDPTGQYLVVGFRRFLIVGLVDPPPESTLFGGGQSESEVLVPFTTAWRMGRGRRMPLFVIGAAQTPTVAEDAASEVRFFLRKQRHIAPGQPDTFQVEFVEAFVRKFNQLASAITLVATGVVGISLLVGGVGISNTMAITVSERTREIGLRKAVGARPVAILLQFLVEAVTICMVGGLVGVVVGQGITAAIASVPHAMLNKAHVPAWAVGLAFGFAGLVGVVFGMYPAIKAARLDPIEALRHE